MRKFFILFITLMALTSGKAQLNMGLLQTDSLMIELSKARHDTSRALIMANISESYRWSNPDSAMYYGLQALSLARHIKFLRGEANALVSISVVQRELGNLPRALDMALKALQIARDNKLYLEEISALIRVANVYANTRNYELAVSYMHQSEALSKKAGLDFYMMVSHWLMASVYGQMNKMDSAEHYARLGFKYKGTDNAGLAFTYNIWGDILMKLKREQEALNNYYNGLQVASQTSDYRTAANLNIGLANYFKEKNQIDSAIYYAKQGLAMAQLLSYQNRIMSSSRVLAELYESKEPQEALKYYKIYNAARDSLYSFESLQALENMTFDEQERLREIEAAKKAYRDSIRLYLLIGGLGILLFTILILFRNNKQKQRANTLLHRQKQEIDLQKSKLEESLENLKSTQAQLIQSEKMASLGELTAGIAHEIQNPLNFVNNFSEVNAELAIELQQELVKGNMDAAIELARNIKENEEKINHHGKRADSIVKSMLQHSRSGTGKKESTDINKLVDECLRLSYHGLRAKDKSFQATFETDLDPALPEIDVVPEDIGRVILNLINNAFYSVNEKKKRMPGNFGPVVKVSTKRSDNEVEIKIKDNGNGIPESVKEKIFQPFFTTKPTGQGTGLGLSLSYDIITKGHHGELKVNSREGEYAEFVIILPINP